MSGQSGLKTTLPYADMRIKSTTVQTSNTATSSGGVELIVFMLVA